MLKDLNKAHQNLIFIVEIEDNGELSFLGYDREDDIYR